MSEGPRDAIGVALLVAAALEQVGARYHVGGSVASSLQGDPRSTNDIDFVIDLPLGRVQAFLTALGEDFQVDAEMLFSALRQGTSANAFYLPWLMKIDFFGHGHEPFDESELVRSQAFELRGRRIFVKSPEDTVLRKLWWFRQGGEVSERQWRDVLGVLRAHAGTIDDAYLDSWAGSLGVAPLLERARREATIL